MIAKRRTTLTLAALSVAIGFGLAGAALAQTAPKTPTPTPSPKTTAPAATAPAKPATPPAATTAKAAPSAAPADDSQNAWIKSCAADPATGKPTCITSTQLLQPNGTPVMSVSFKKITGEDKTFLDVVVPINVFLPEGVVVIVDGVKKGTAPYMICAPSPTICIAEIAVDAASFDSIRKGKQLSLQATMVDRKPMKYDIPLVGFSKAYDSAGVDPALAQAKDAELNQALQKRAAEQRQKLIDEQNKATAAR